MDKPPQRRMFDIERNTLDDSGNRIIDIDLNALRTDRQALYDALYIKEPFDLVYRVTHGTHAKAGTLDLQDPRFQLIFEHGVDPSGVWTVEITARDPDGWWDTTVWRQQIFVQTRLARDKAHIDELARRFAPIFVFSERESYFPVSLETLLGAPAIQASPQTMSIETIFGDEDIPVGQLGDFMRFNGHSDYLLNFGFFDYGDSAFAQIGGDRSDIVVYYSYLEDPGTGRFFITYHMLYAFDTKVGLAKWAGIGPHVFDRESMIMVFEAGAEAPSAMIISGHLEDQTIFLLDKLKIWTQGRIRVPFDDPHTLKLGDHPVVAVAEGSHALYPTCGVYHLMMIRELAGFIYRKVMPWEADTESKSEELLPDQIVRPASLSSPTLPGYTLKALGLDSMCSHIDTEAQDYDGHNAYLCFSGFWVDVLGPVNARFPPFTRKISEIADWIEGAFEWSWEDLPEQIHHNNDLILRFLKHNIDNF